MRDGTTPLYKELTANGNESISITPTTSGQTGTFTISGVPPVVDDMRNYAQGFYGHLSTTFDADAAGSAVSWDKLHKGMQSWRLSSPMMGDLFPHLHTRGAVMGHLTQVVALGYTYPQSARAQIPASTDADYVVDIFYFVPMSYEVLKKPHETSQWVGFFDGGTFEGIVGTADVYNGDYAGAVIKAPTTLRAVVEYVPSPDIYLGVPNQWRERQIVGGSQPLLKGVGMETNLTGVQPGCGLAGMFWLSDAAGIGLDGPDGVDNITAMELTWRDQKLLRNLDPIFLNLKKTVQHRPGPISGLGTTIMNDGAGWPSTMDSTPNNRPAANAQNYFLPMIYPGKDFETSKAQRVVGDLQLNFTVTTPITGTHRVVTWELMEWTEDQVARLARGMGVDLSLYKASRKSLLDNSPSAGALRYTRIVFSPVDAPTG